MSSPTAKKHPEASWDAYIRVSGGAVLYEEFKSRGAKIIREPEVTFYEMREFEVEDCDGYVLCFGNDTGEEEAARRRSAAVASATSSVCDSHPSGGTAMKSNG